MDKIDELKDDIKQLGKKFDDVVDKKAGFDVKPVHYIMIALLLVGIVSNWVN